MAVVGACRARLAAQREQGQCGVAAECRALLEDCIAALKDGACAADAAAARDVRCILANIIRHVSESESDVLSCMKRHAAPSHTAGTAVRLAGACTTGEF